MSLKDYLTYRKLEREFIGEYDPKKEFVGNPVEYLEGLREGKKSAIKRMAKKSLITLTTLVTLLGSGLYLHKSNERYKEILSESAIKADLDGDGKVSGAREMAEFFNNLPYPAKYFIRP